MKLLNTVKTKLRARRGESIAEVLVALLISSVGLVMLAGMISTGSDMILRSREKVADYIAAENELVAQGSSDKLGSVAVQTEDSPGVLRPLRLNDGDSTNEIPVHYYTDTEIGGRAVVSYR